jgi:hypothetical protein
MNVSVWPEMDGSTDEVTVVVVLAWLTLNELLVAEVRPAVLAVSV